jgi:hypothetical protein
MIFYGFFILGKIAVAKAMFSLEGLFKIKG